MLGDYSFDKQVIAGHFSQAAKQYDKHADLQQRVAKHAQNLASKHLSKQAVITAVDLGCGTANAALALSDYCEHWINLDISSDMLAIGASKNKKNTKTTFSALNADAEHLPFLASSVDFMYSSMALQWCKDPLQIVTEIERVLTFNGRAVLAIMTGESFADLHEAWTVQGLPSRLNKFHASAKWLDAMARSGLIVTYHHECFETHHDSILQMLQSMKSVGANTRLAGRMNNQQYLPKPYIARKELNLLQAHLSEQQDVKHNTKTSPLKKHFCLEYKVLFVELHKAFEEN